jgi:hypothetical protein
MLQKQAACEHENTRTGKSVLDVAHDIPETEYCNDCGKIFDESSPQ